MYLSGMHYIYSSEKESSLEFFGTFHLPANLALVYKDNQC